MDRLKIDIIIYWSFLSGFPERARQPNNRSEKEKHVLSRIAGNPETGEPGDISSFHGMFSAVDLVALRIETLNHIRVPVFKRSLSFSRAFRLFFFEDFGQIPFNSIHPFGQWMWQVSLRQYVCLLNFSLRWSCCCEPTPEILHSGGAGCRKNPGFHRIPILLKYQAVPWFRPPPQSS